MKAGFLIMHSVEQSCRNLHKFCIFGAGIFGHGSCSRHLNFLVPAPIKFLTPAPAWFGPLWTKNNCIICAIGLLHKLCLLKGSSNLRLRLHHLKFFFSGSGHAKLLGLRLHSPGWNYTQSAFKHLWVASTSLVFYVTSQVIWVFVFFPLWPTSYFALAIISKRLFR